MLLRWTNLFFKFMFWNCTHQLNQSTSYQLSLLYPLLCEHFTQSQPSCQQYPSTFSSFHYLHSSLLLDLAGTHSPQLGHPARFSTIDLPPLNLLSFFIFQFLRSGFPTPRVPKHRPLISYFEISQFFMISP